MDFLTKKSEIFSLGSSSQFYALIKDRNRKWLVMIITPNTVLLLTGYSTLRFIVPKLSMLTLTLWAIADTGTGFSVAKEMRDRVANMLHSDNLCLWQLNNV